MGVIMDRARLLPECPFYGSDFGARSSRRHIACEGITDQSRLRLYFDSTAALRDFEVRYCCGQFRQCPIFAAIMLAKYAE